MHSIPLLSCTSGPLAIPGGTIDFTYGGFVMSLGTFLRGETIPGLKRLRLLLDNSSIFLQRQHVKV
jgi:hypothetical protein